MRLYINNYTLGLFLKVLNISLKIIHVLLYDKLEHDRHSNILIYRIGNIGDILCSLPAIKAVRKKYPKAEITLLTSGGGATSAASILNNISWIDEIKVYSSSDFDSIGKVYCFAMELKEKRYDCLINLPNVAGGVMAQIRNMLFFKLAGIPAGGNFYIHNLKIAPKLQIGIIDDSNEVVRLLKNLPFQYEGEVDFGYTFNNIVKNRVEGYLISENLRSKKIMAISFSCKGDAKKWPLDRFACIAKKWIQDCHGAVILIGGPDDKLDANEILNIVKNENCHDLCGEFTIQESIYLMSQIYLLVGLDTGTAHMASVVGCRSITLFAGFDFPNIWNPYGENSIIIRKNLDCSPCLSKDCKYGFPSRCMKAITVEEVWDAVIKTMAKEGL